MQSVEIKTIKSQHGLAGKPSNNPNGRPKGLITRISGVTILKSIQEHAGRDFATLLAEGYVDAIDRQDHKLRFEYEKVILSKVVADKVEVTMVDDRVSEIIKNLQQDSLGDSEAEPVDADFTVIADGTDQS